MDFTPTDGQIDAAALAGQLLRDRCTTARLAEVERDGGRFDRDLWTELASAGLVGLALPEEHGGAGLGVLELVSVLEQAGKVVAPLPLVVHVPAAMALARFGTAEQKDRWLADAVTGRCLLTVAVTEDRAAFPEQPETTASCTAAGWSLTGTKTVVLAGMDAALLLVPARTEEGTRVFLLRPDDPGVGLATQQLTGGERAARVELDGACVGAERLLGGPEVPGWLAQHLSVALAALQLGVCEGALRLTAEYARTREQFQRPIGSFQAVSQRLADGYIDVQGLRLTVTQAAWRLAEALPAEVEVATARLWAANAGHRLAHTTVHVHGGVGIDLDGPAHRYFTAAKRVEHLLGGATAQGLTIGRLLAAEPA